MADDWRDIRSVPTGERVLVCGPGMLVQIARRIAVRRPLGVRYMAWGADNPDASRVISPTHWIPLPASDPRAAWDWGRGKSAVMMEGDA